jgi:hypothetical protein
MVRHAALTRTPVWLSRGKLLHSRAIRDFQMVNLPVRLPNLPAALEGLRITHLSDLHVGDLIRPDHLPAIVQATNGLHGDLIALTGDFVDLRLNVLDEVIDALRQLHAPLGVYLVLGNHDHLDNAHKLVAAFRDAKLNLLMNERVNVPVNGHDLTVAGIDWSPRRSVLGQSVREALNSKAMTIAGATHTRLPDHASKRSDRCALKLLLSHHPNAFEAAIAHGVDLTLAGHTHGGQVVFSNKRGKKGSIGLASLAHRYPKGLFQRGHRYLYVTSGVGSWFPLRVKCPPEIACLTLTGEERS